MAIGVITFGGQAIFGLYQNQIIGPTPTVRSQRHKLPGVPGYRVFNLTGNYNDTKIFVCTGRIVAFSLDDCMIAVESGLSFMHSKLYVFTTLANRQYRNCELTDFRQSSKYMRIRFPQDITRDYFTVEVRGTIEQASPI